MAWTRLSPEEAASFIKHGETVAFSGFTPAGAPKVISLALAAKAESEHRAGRDFKIGVISGASTGPSLDGALAKANAIAWRTPYQSNKDLRDAINSGRAKFFDMHLSMVAQQLRYQTMGKVQHAVIEAADIDDEGNVVLTTGVGCTPTFARYAEKIVIELNARHPKSLRGFHDLYEPKDPPHRREIPIYGVSDRIGTPLLKIDPKKIVGIVETNVDDETGTFRPCDETTLRIGANVAAFLAGERKAGRIPDSFLPIQSGVGETANAVLKALGENPDIPTFQMYTEVIQDAVIALMQQERVTFVSGCSLTVPPATLDGIYADWEFFRSRLLLRPQEITNNPEVVRRIGTISINTAIEVDLSGNVNSTHVLGRNMMNGIGGSADFARAAFLSMFICPSTAKGGTISTIVPMVSHLDSSEHSVSIIVTEQGVADLRGRAPSERAQIIIEKCAHPDYKPLLRDYVKRGGNGHTLQSLGAAFGMHQSFGKNGDMRKVNWADFG